MDINKAILHILDFGSNISVYSQRELEIDNSELKKLLFRYLRKVMNDSNQIAGEFYNNSDFARMIEEYNMGNSSFTDFSTDTAKRIYDEIFASDNMKSSDLLFVDFSNEGYEYIGILLLENKKAYSCRVVNDESGLRNDIVENTAILPAASQKINTYAVIDRNNMNIIYNDIIRTADSETVFIMPQKILGCKPGISAKGALETVTRIISEVAEENEEDAVAAVTMAKKLIVDNSDFSETFSPFEAADEIFEKTPALKVAYESKLKEARIPETINVEKKKVISSSRNQKIRTNTGIEITFPVDYYGDSNFIEFIDNPDGTMSIQLKNIEKITNK